MNVLEEASQLLTAYAIVILAAVRRRFRAGYQGRALGWLAEIPQAISILLSSEIQGLTG